MLEFIGLKCRFLIVWIFHRLCSIRVRSMLHNMSSGILRTIHFFRIVHLTILYFLILLGSELRSWDVIGRFDVLNNRLLMHLLASLFQVVHLVIRS